MDYGSQIRKCRSFLKDHDVGVIATATYDGEPHASVVNYFANDKFEVFFIARDRAQKFKNIMSNPRASFVIADPTFAMSLEIEGDAFKLEDTEETVNLLSQLAAVVRRKNAGPLPIMRHPGSELHLFCLKAGHLTYADFRPTYDEGEYFEVDVEK